MKALEIYKRASQQVALTKHFALWFQTLTNLLWGCFFFYHHVIILGVLMFSRLSEADALLMTILNSSFSMETGYPENSVEPWGGSTNDCKSMCQLKPNQEIWGNSGLMFINWSVLRVCACLYGQAGRLTEFYEMCKSMDFARNFQFPVLEQVCFVVLLIGVVHYTTSSILGISASCTSKWQRTPFIFVWYSNQFLNIPHHYAWVWLCDETHQCLSSRELSKKAVTKLSLCG